MFNLKSIVLGIVACATLAATSRASALTIDTFDSNPAPALNMFVTVGSPPSENTQTGVAGVLGGDRHSKLTVISGPEDAMASMRVIGSLPNRRLSLSSEADVTAQWELDYGPLGGIDITSGGLGYAIALHFLTADHTATVTATLDIPGPATLTQTLVKPIGPGVLEFKFNLFAPSPVTSATAINGIHFDILGQPDGDYSIEFIDTSVQETPEPSTLALGSLGLVGLFGWGWKRYRGRKS